MQLPEIIQKQIENMVCPVHDIHPIVEQDWDGIKISTCCDDFQKECTEQLEVMLNQSQTVK